MPEFRRETFRDSHLLDAWNPSGSPRGFAFGTEVPTLSQAPLVNAQPVRAVHLVPGGDAPAVGLGAARAQHPGVPCVRGRSDQPAQGRRRPQERQAGRSAHDPAPLPPLQNYTSSQA
jgi:hypothetical protein